MSDQDTDDKKEQNEAEAALDIELVPVEEAEEEAVQSRGENDPEQVLVEEELAEQIADVLDQAEVEAEEVSEETSKVENNISEDDASEEKDPDTKTPEELEDGFIVIDDHQMNTSNDSPEVSTASVADIEGLTGIVLDAAEAANKAAHSTNQSIHMLLASVTAINNMAKGLRKTNKYVLGFIITLGVVGLLSGAVMLYVLQSAVKDATTINMAMGTKLVQFEKQMDRVNLLEAQLIDIADVNQQLGQRIEQAMYYLKQVGTDSQQAASQQSAENQLMLGSVNDQILMSFDDLQNTTKAQQGVLTQLQKRIDGLQVQMKKIQNQDLVGKMKALIALEQGRYFQLEQAKLALETAQFEAKQKADAPPVEDTYITFGAKSE
jgi:hypothetical protein